MTNSSKLFSFSDEFREWAREEDRVNNQKNSNWIPAYVIITLIPIGFILCAALASRNETKRQASERAARAARIGELLPGWLRDSNAKPTLAGRGAAGAGANSTSQAATGTEQQHGRNNNDHGFRLSDLEAGLARGPPATATPTVLPGAWAIPTKPRARSDSVSSDTGAVVDGGGEIDDAGHETLPRRKRKKRGPSASHQHRQQHQQQPHRH